MILEVIKNSVHFSAGLLATTFVLEAINPDRDVTNTERERRKRDVSYERDIWVTTILKAKVRKRAKFAEKEG